MNRRKEKRIPPGSALTVSNEPGRTGLWARMLNHASTSYPDLGRARDEDLRPGLRTFPVGEYVVLYRVENEDVVILRVLRGGRNIAALFGH
jgi:hypothetical protein